jgi:hypothetical protein
MDPGMHKKALAVVGEERKPSKLIRSHLLAPRTIDPKIAYA